MTLNTGWKKWDKFLTKFVDKKINCLDLGSYEGASTVWMLQNLCGNSESMVYSVDTWKGSPEYTSVDFGKIENTFNENVNNSGKISQNIKLKMTTKQGLIYLQNNSIMFDFIFIDASHIAKDVFTDAILSWDILKENGILIFDDYEWDKMSKEYFNPKIAIDGFVKIFSPELKTLYAGYQYIVEKINNRDYEKPELTDFYKLLDNINNYKVEQYEIIFTPNELNNEKNINLEFNIVTDTKSSELIDNKLDIFFKFYYMTYQQNPNLEKYIFSKLLNIKNPIEIISATLKNLNINYDNNVFFKNFDYNVLKNSENIFFDSTLFNINKTNINVLLFIRDNSILDEKYLKKYIYDKYKINILHLNIVKIEDTLILKNYEDYKKIISKFENIKFDLLEFKIMIPSTLGLRKLVSIHKSFINYEYIYKLFWCLKLQNIGGNAILHFEMHIYNLLIEIIYILNMFYKKIIITSTYRNNLNKNSSFVIKCYDFIGIPENILKNFEKNIIKISNINNNYFNFNQHNYVYIFSIIKITQSKFDFIKNKLLLFINKKIISSEKYLKLLSNIEQYLKSNTNVKHKNLLENTIYKKQITEFVKNITKI